MDAVRTALIWSLAERYASLVVTVLSTMILARLLTPGQIGIFSMCAAVTAVAGILRDFGISEYLIQEKDLNKEKIRAALGIALLMAWSIGATIFFSRHYIADFYQEKGIAEVLTVLTLNFLLLPFASPSAALLNRDMAFRKVFAVQTTSTLVHAVTAVALAYNGYGYMSLAWAQVIGITTQILVLAVLRPDGTMLLPSLKEAKAVLQYGSMFATSRLIETFTRNAHEFVVARQFGFAAVGLFSRSFGLIELFYTNVASAVLRVATPSFASDHRAGLNLAASFSRGTAIITSIAWPFFGFIALMSADIVRVLFGSQWDAAAPIATILALTVMPAYLYALGPNILAATGHVKTRLRISLIFSPVHLLGIVLGSFISLFAVAAVWFVTNSLMLVLYIYHLRRVLKATAQTLFTPSLNSIAAAGFSIAAQAITQFACRQAGLIPLVALIFVAASGGAAWLLAVWMLKHPAFDEITRLLPRRNLPK